MISLKNTLNAIARKCTTLASNITKLQTEVVDQTAGNSVTLTSGGTIQSYNNSAYGMYVFIQFPFVTKNTNYTISIDYINIVNRGSSSQVNFSINTKYNTGVFVWIKNYYFSGTAFGQIVYTITFA